jgi:hypothetical protein
MVQAILAGNQIQAKILDVLTYGTINEKLTLILAVLDDIKANTVYRPSDTSIQETVTNTVNENERNIPSQPFKPEQRKNPESPSSRSAI